MEARSAADNTGTDAPRNGADDSAARTESRTDGDDGQGAFDGDEMRRVLTASDRQYAAQTGVERRIHMIGTGSIGKLVAHALRGIPNPPPITLIFHRGKLLEAWEESKKEITIEDEGHKVARGGFDVELLPVVRRRHGVELQEGQPDVYDGDVKPHEAAERLRQQQLAPKDDQEPLESDTSEQQEAARPKETGPLAWAVSDKPIHNLIITTKAAFTVPALVALRHRLSRTSTICFLQNGMGVIDDVNKLFPDEQQRPNYIQGIVSHGVNVPPGIVAHDPFYAVHAGHGTIALGLLPRSGLKPSTVKDADEDDVKDVKTELWDPSARYVLRTLTRTPVLCAVGFTPTELLLQQLEKLAVNSVLNPLTALFDARNGMLLYTFAITRTMRLLLAETSLVFRSLPELQSLPTINSRFSPERLETLVVSVAHKTGNNISSMLADVRAGRKTEIEYINGYIVRRGEEIGIKCVVNYAIMQTVIGKSQITQREAQDAVPVEESSKPER